MIERGFVLFASCASEPSAKPVCLWHKPLKANSGDTSMANEQDTSLVVPVILREGVYTFFFPKKKNLELPVYHRIIDFEK